VAGTHTSPTTIAKAAIEWTPQGTRSRGRPRTTWRRTILEEIRYQGKTWNEVKAHARNRVRWRNFVRALCSLEERREIIIIISSSSIKAGKQSASFKVRQSLTDLRVICAISGGSDSRPLKIRRNQLRNLYITS